MLPAQAWTAFDAGRVIHFVGFAVGYTVVKLEDVVGVLVELAG